MYVSDSAVFSPVPQGTCTHPLKKEVHAQICPVLVAGIGLVCSFLGSFDSSDLQDALGEPLCPTGLGRQRRGAARLLVLAEARRFPLPVVGSP